MASREWEFLLWQQAGDLLRQAERIQRNFLQVAAGAQYRSTQGRGRAWEPPVNIVETQESLWVISAIPGVAKAAPIAYRRKKFHIRSKSISTGRPDCYRAE